MGHKRRAVLNLSDRAAQDLIDRKTAKPYKEPVKKNVRKASEGLSLVLEGEHIKAPGCRSA